MRENDAEQIVATLLNESQIGKDQVDAGIAWIGKGKDQIYHDPFSLGSIEIDIHANLSRPAEGQEKQFMASVCHLSICNPLMHQRQTLYAQVRCDLIHNILMFLKQNCHATRRVHYR